MTLRQFPFYAIWLGGILTFYGFTWKEWPFWIIIGPVILLVAINSWEPKEK